MDTRMVWEKKLKDRKAILLGTEEVARSFFWDFKDRLNICGAVSAKTGETALYVGGEEVCPIVCPEECLTDKEYFVIVCTEDYYEREDLLAHYGYRYGEDYADEAVVRCLLEGKKIGLFYGICYVRSMMECMICSCDFAEEYKTWCFVSYKPFTGFEQEMFSFLLPICDLYVYNSCISVRERNKNEALKRRLKEECRICSIPVIEFRGYHPQTLLARGKDNMYCVTSRRTSYAPFLSPDCNINKQIAEGKNPEEILKSVQNIDFYSKSFLEKTMKQQYQALSYAEDGADIKISDYLKERQGKERLFCNERHMTNSVILELSGRVLAFLGYAVQFPVQKLLSRRLLNTTEVPLYPSVIAHLDLEIYGEAPDYDLFSFTKRRRVTFEEYVFFYVDFCTNMKHYMETGFFPEESAGWNVRGAE